MINRKNTIFTHILYSVWVFLGLYIPIFSLLHAKLALVVHLAGFFALSPFTLFLIKKGKLTDAKLFFILCCNLYIYSTSLSLRHAIGSEYYYMPATMIPLLIFDLSQFYPYLFGIFLPYLMWCLTKWFGFKFVNPAWLSSTDLNEMISAFNFTGSFILTLIFLHTFMKSVYLLHELLAKTEKEKRDELQEMIKVLKEQKISLTECQKIAKIGNWTFDLSTSKILWSDQLFGILPHKKEEGEPSFDQQKATIHPSDLPDWNEAVTQCMRNGTPYLLTFKVENIDGSGEKDANGKNYIWVEGRGQAHFDSNQKITGLFGTCQDIHEQKCLQIQFSQERARAIHNEKLANLGEMSAGVAHEINNPLAIIKGTLQLMEKTLPKDEKTDKRVKSLEKSIERISKIVSGLRKFSRTTEHKELKPCDLGSIVSEVMDFIRIKADLHQVKIEVDTQSTLKFLADEVEIEQVLVNLINNGIDAVKEGQQKWIKITSKDQENKIILQITDSGSGIPLRVRNNIFDPFFTTKKVGEGTGLGLSIARGIVKSYQGSLELLDSSPNTCFEITFPQIRECPPNR